MGSVGEDFGMEVFRRPIQNVFATAEGAEGIGLPQLVAQPEDTDVHKVNRSSQSNRLSKIA